MIFPQQPVQIVPATQQATMPAIQQAAPALQQAQPAFQQAVQPQPQVQQVAQALNQPGYQTAQQVADMPWYERAAQRLTGRDAQGNLLQGGGLTDFQRANGIAAALAGAGRAIGGDTTGGRLGDAVYGFAAGNLASMNTAQSEKTMNDYLQAALGGPGYMVGEQASPASQAQAPVQGEGAKKESGLGSLSSIQVGGEGSSVGETDKGKAIMDGIYNAYKKYWEGGI